MYPPVIYMEPQRRTHKMEALYARGTRIEDQHITPGIPHYLQYVRVTADKDIWPELVDQGSGPGIVSARITADVSHQNLHSLTFETPVKRVSEPQVMIVTIACHPDKRLVGGHFLCKLQSASEVSGMPDLIHRIEEFTELRAEHAMRV